MSGWDEALPCFLTLWITSHFNITNNEFAGQHSRTWTRTFCVGSLEGASVELFSARKIKLYVLGTCITEFVTGPGKLELGKQWVVVVLDIFLFSKMSENYRLGLKKNLPSRSIRQRAPFVPIFPGQSRFYDFQTSVPVSLKIRFGAPNGLECFLVTQNITFLTTRTNLLPFPLWQKSYVRQPSNQRLTVIIIRRRRRCVRYWLQSVD